MHLRTLAAVALAIGATVLALSRPVSDPGRRSTPTVAAPAPADDAGPRIMITAQSGYMIAFG